MLTSYHVHSNLSDGIADMEQMVLAAIGAGLKEVGISDHYLMFPNGQTLDWSMPLDFLPQYVERVLALKEKYKEHIIVRLGLEADYLPETVYELKAKLAEFPFDYVLGSVHVVDGFPIDDTPDYWEAIDQDKRNQISSTYWDRIKELADSRVFDIAGHLDLHKKFAYLPTIDLTNKIDAALDSIAAAGMCLELNTSGWHKPVKEQYPSGNILRSCLKRGIQVIVTADAHEPEHIRRDFEKATALLSELGITGEIFYQARVAHIID